MESLTITFCLSILFQLFKVTVSEVAYFLNARSCSQVLNLDFDVYELDCLYVGYGQYRYVGPSTVRVLKIDRLLDSTLTIPDNTMLERVYIRDGEFCPNVNAPTRVQVHLADILCVSCISL